MKIYINERAPRDFIFLTLGSYWIQSFSRQAALPLGRVIITIGVMAVIAIAINIKITKEEQ